MFFFIDCCVFSMIQPDVVIIGASTRAAAAMCRRAGLIPACFDQYGDSDLQQIAAQVTLTDFHADGLPGVAPEVFASRLESSCWFYTGPLENHPAWIGRAALNTQLFGNSSEVIQSVRNLQLLERVCSKFEHFIKIPETRAFDDRPGSALGKWLWKPFHSSGGWTVRKARKQISIKHDLLKKPESSQGYWQRRINGPTFGVTLASDCKVAKVLGVCRSLRGAPQRPFAYGGSTGPVNSSRFQHFIEHLQPVASLISGHSQLRGLWNMDVVFEPRHKQWYLLEINPRPSASMEVLELAVQKSLMQIHMAIFRNDNSWMHLADDFANLSTLVNRPVFKKIIYRTNPLSTSECRRERRFVRSFELWPETSYIADFPANDVRIAAGLPLWSSIEIPSP